MGGFRSRVLGASETGQGRVPGLSVTGTANGLQPEQTTEIRTAMSRHGGDITLTPYRIERYIGCINA